MATTSPGVPKQKEIKQDSSNQGASEIRLTKAVSSNVKDKSKYVQTRAVIHQAGGSTKRSFT